jgi:formylglycine-generating enzyme required for sulfatase activity
MMKIFGLHRVCVLGFVLFLLILFLVAAVPRLPGGDAAPDPRIGAQVFIRSGNYYVGNPTETNTKSHRLMAFRDFYIDIHPVTNFQYVEFINRSRYHPRGKFSIEEARKNPWLPATGLTHADAEAFADFHQKRLPTEWEWEIAARSLEKDVLYATGSLPTLETGNFYRYKQKNGVTPGFSYPPNKLGIYGMAGNVFEWTSSLYPVEKLKGAYFQKYRLMVLRGGAWTNIPHDVRVTTRTPFPASRSLEWLGFRCVSDKPVQH